MVVENQVSWLNLILTKGVTHNKQVIVDLSVELIKELLRKTQKFEEITEPLLENMKSTNIKVSLTNS